MTLPNVVKLYMVVRGAVQYLFHDDPVECEEAMDRVPGIRVVRHELAHLDVCLAAGVVEQSRHPTIPS